METRDARFRRLLEPLHDRLNGFARSLCRTMADGDDLFQDAMIHAFAKLDTLRDDTAFRAWVHRIVINRHRSRHRRLLWRRLVPLRDDDVTDAELYRSTGWSRGSLEANRRARAALARLPIAIREAIVLFEIEGWQVEEIAEVQRVSISAIKSRLARGRMRLRAHYEEEPSLAHALQGEQG